MSVNENKVKEAIKEIKTWGFAPLPVGMIVAKLEEAIAPEQPEIPEGCPVLAGSSPDSCTYPTFYVRKEGMLHLTITESFPYVEIDYQRKGHVIPWHGGACPFLGNPIDDEEKIMGFCRDGSTVNIEMDSIASSTWPHNGNGADIIAYVIWAEWVKS